MTRATRGLCALHLVGNALLLWLAYYWLGVGESTIARLIWSALLALIIIAAGAWLHGASFAFFQTDRSSLITAMRAALRNLPRLLLLAITVLVIYGLMAWWHTKALLAVQWAILPILVLPLASRGFNAEAWKKSRQWRYWIEIVVLLFIGVWVPLKLITWVPHFASFTVQMISFSVRLVIGYLLFVAAWLRVAQVS